MIKLEHIEVTFGSFKALKDINIDIHEGEFFTFLGPSGCGKTTTLRTITGFISPSAGTVSVRGKDITHTPIEKRNIGMVFQSYALFPTMTVYENIAFGLQVQKMDKEEIRKKVVEMGKKVDLNEEQLKKKVSELSGGQQQRVAIARALVTNPEIICLDEPLSNLDAKLRVQLRNELKDLQKRFGITTVYVTHDQEEALTLSDRIAVFNKGVIEQIGHPDEIYSHSATEFVCNFIGDINRLTPEFLAGTGADKVEGVDPKKHCYIRLERMGNVLVRFDPELFMDRYSLTGEDRRLIRNEVFRSVEWTMLDRGVIDEEIAERRILPRLPERLHDAARGLIEKWDDPIVPVEGMLELLQALKAKGYRLYLLSNAATRQPIYWARAEASKLMDGALISAEVKLLKPDPQIYRTFLHKFALRPEECVFIDDTPINVEGALYENMAGIVFNMDVAALAESLRSLGVEW